MEAPAPRRAGGGRQRDGSSARLHPLVCRRSLASIAGPGFAWGESMTEPIGYHVVMRLEDSRIICTSASARREMSRVFYEQGELPGWLLAFRAVDTHLHALLRCTRAEAGAFARRVETSLRWRLGLEVSFDRARYKPVGDQHHLETSFPYIMRQESRHGVALDPFHDGSNLPDLIGARVLLPCPRHGGPGTLLGRGLELLGAATARAVATFLPRVRRRYLLALVGIRRGPIAIELGDLADAAAAALGLAKLAGRGDARTIARLAAVHVVDAPTRQLAEALRISTRAVQLLRATPPWQPAVRAVGLQLRMRAAHRALPIEDRPLGE